MAQIFSARTDRLLRRLLLALPLLFVLLLGIGFYQFRSDAHWGVGKTAEQPIGFRHDLHVRELGLDCAFCHSGAERAAAAGMPSASTCLGCHSQLWRGVDALRPLFTSVELGQPIEWKSLYRLPEHTRFHHGAHAASGVGCAACHGDVAAMVKTEKSAPMSMAWCLDCHRQVGERQQQALVRSSGPQPAANVAFANPRLTDCSTCHY